MSEIVNLVQIHSDAYNEHNLEKFLSCFSDTIQFFRPPATEPLISGKDQLSKFYAEKRFNLPALRSELLNRMVVGNKVVDHERTFGLSEHPVEAVLVNEVENDLIQTVWVFV